MTTQNDATDIRILIGLANAVFYGWSRYHMRNSGQTPNLADFLHRNRPARKPGPWRLEDPVLDYAPTAADWRAITPVVMRMAASNEPDPIPDFDGDDGNG